MSRIALLAVLTLGATAGTSCADRPIALIFQVKGDVKILAADGMSRKAAMFGGIYAAEKLAVAGDGSVSVRFASDGHRETVAKAGEWQLATTGLQPQANVQVVASTNERGKPLGELMRALPEPQGGNGRLGGVTVARSGDQEGPTVSPMDSEVVLGGAPILTWPPRTGVARYRVFVNSNGKKIWSGTMTETTATVPPEQLQPGMRCDWQVVDARPGGGTVVKASFTMAFPSQQEQARLLQEVATEGTESRAFAALTAESHRFYHLALGLYQDLARETNDATFHAALAELYGRAGREEAAGKARQTAEELGFLFTNSAAGEPKPE